MEISVQLSNVGLNVCLSDEDELLVMKMRLTMASRSLTLGGTKMDCTMNLCLLFSLGS
uniref:Uncharacterized protein n=1 Tax=Sinocyclocheilus rhinocerous TaxID=307959 RepID=A0A673HIY5_9TELE